MKDPIDAFLDEPAGGNDLDSFLDEPAQPHGLNPLLSATQSASVEPPATLAYSLVPGPEPEHMAQLGRGFLGQPPRAAGPGDSIAYEIGRVGLPTALSIGGQVAGALVGGAAGTAAAPGAGTAAGALTGGSIGAGIGAGLGTAIQSGARALAAARKTPGVTAPTIGQAAGDVGISAAMNAAFVLGGGMLAKGAAALKPGAVRIGAQLLRSGPAIPEKYGAAALANLEKLAAAETPETVSASYQAFEKYTGLKSLGQQIVERGESFSPKQLERLIIATAKRVAGGQQVPPQELYTASQAASKLKLFAKYGEPQARSVVEAGIIDQSKGLVEGELERVYPEYANLRSDYFWSKVAGQFRSPLPLNKDQSPNALRSFTTVGGAAAAAAAGHPGALLAIPAISPAVWGVALRGTELGSRAVAPLLPYAQAAGANYLADAYRRQPSPAR